MDDWPLLSAVKAGGKKKKWGRKKRKKGNRSHTGCASPQNCICAGTVGEEALHPPSCQPHPSAGIGDGDAELAEGADPSWAAPLTNRLR